MDALILAVLNALWQGAALIALVALALRAGLRRNATTACVVWSITFLVVALLPALDLALATGVAPVAVVHPAESAVHVTAARVTAARVSSERVSGARVSGARAFAPTIAPSQQRSTGSIESFRAAFGERVRAGSMLLGGAATAFARAWGLALLCAWAFVAATLLLRLTRGYVAVMRLKRVAVPLDEPIVLARLHAAGHRRRATVALSQLVAVPCAVGFRRPMILIPARLAASLDADDLARVVLHESAHLQRYDDWLNALEQVVCALQFFQPALHVARRGIDFEREVACDDRVLEAAGDPLRYAECLARIVQRSARGPRVAVAPGFVLRRAQVVGRVRRIVDRTRDASPRPRFAAVALTALVLAATLGIARLQVPVVAAASAATPVRAANAPARALRVRPVHVRAAHAAAHAVAARVTHTREMTPTAIRTYAKTMTMTATTIATTTVAQTTDNFSANTVTTAPPARTGISARTHARATARDGSTGSPEARPAPVAQPAPVEVAARAPVAIREAVGPAESIAPAAVRDSGGDLLDALDEAKYPHSSVDELIALRNQGVSGDYVRLMAAVMHPRPALHDLVSLAVQGITPDYVAGLNRRLAAAPSPDQIVAVRVQGVSIAWLDGLAAAGYPKLSSEDAVALAVQGVSAAFVRGLLDAGLHNLTPHDLVTLRIQGVEGSFVRRLTAHGYKNLSVDDLVRLKASGF
jgi:beta-lactamase regulating signal transducer with metallopeptidase domain